MNVLRAIRPLPVPRPRESIAVQITGLIARDYATVSKSKHIGWFNESLTISVNQTRIGRP
jgi:hypothetical protein